ncbi:MAG: hypothetical protein K0Q87_3768 [Neobacillus sp.]|jgi:hypothetical protein|nr:hypothetical protein [Neobacillus sp.]
MKTRASAYILADALSINGGMVDLSYIDNHPIRNADVNTDIYIDIDVDVYINVHNNIDVDIDNSRCRACLLLLRSPAGAAVSF